MMNDYHKLLDATLDKWRRVIFFTHILCVVVVMLTECGMFYVLQSNGLLIHTPQVYLNRFFVLPTIINLIILLGGWMLAKPYVHHPKILNYLTIIQLILTCFVVSTVHHVFAVTFSIYIFPIFLTVIFNDRMLTRLATMMSLICLTVAQFIGPTYNGVLSKYLLPEYLVALITLFASNLICTVLRKFQEEKNETIQKIHLQQVSTLEKLNLDQKTGLYGITAFNNTLSQLVEEHPEENQLAMAIFDIDDFKWVNDTYGHGKGDEVICRIAEILKEVCGEQYFPARFGGEEFIILFTKGNKEVYHQQAELVLVEFAQSQYGFTKKQITVSAGFAMWQPDMDGNSLFDAADRALYYSKSRGKNRITHYDSSMTDQPIYCTNH